MSDHLVNFARVNDAAAATSRKLVKQQVLADYFRALAGDDDLRRAVRFAGGRAFAVTQDRTLNVGGALVSDVALAILQAEPNAYWQTVIQSGEIGEALARLWPKRNAGDAAARPLTLRDLEASFDELRRVARHENKRAILLDLFSRCRDPREAAYLAKIIFGDLRTGVQQGVLQAAVAQAFGRALAEIQRAQLLVGDLDEVAVLARHDALASATFRLFHPIQFMLASPVETAQEAEARLSGRAFFAEDKLDGIRAQVHKSADRIVIYTRTMDRADESFPDVVQAVSRWPGEFLLDGEIVCWQGGCVMPFGHLQKRLGRKRLTADVLRDNPAIFIAFDILFRDGQFLMDEPLRHRRAILESLCGDDRDDRDRPCDRPVLTEVRELNAAGEIAKAFDAARDRGNEGLVLKDPDSRYSPGRRGFAWLKLKTHLPTLDCVVTAAEHGHGKRRGVLSDYTFAVWDRDPAQPGAALANVGKAYSGVTDEEIAQLTELFRSISRAQHGPVHIVEPRVVLEIAFDQIQKSARHASGFALRFPRIKRIRWDKRVEDADRLARVAEIYESSHNFGRGGAKATRSESPEPTLFDDTGTGS